MKALARVLVFGLSLMMLGVVAGGIVFHRIQERHLQSEVESRLRAIAQLKVNQIAQWRTARMAEASVQAESPLMTEALERWMESPSAELTELLRARLLSFRRHYHYRDALLVDADGRVRLSPESTNGPLHAEIAAALAEAVQGRRAVITDLHAESSDPMPHIGVVAPFFARHGGSNAPVGALVLMGEARQFLYPLISAWPTPSSSAETLLVRRDGDSVLYLNELRHQSNTALRLRFPLTRTDLPAVQAVMGRTGIVKGRDYRGVAVVSALLPVPDSPWFMVAKMDVAEAFRTWRIRSAFIIMTSLLLLLVAAAFVATILQRNERDHYRDLFESGARFHSLFDHMVEGVALHEMVRDDSGKAVNYRVVDVNGAYLRILGLSRDNVTGRLGTEVYGTPDPPYLAEFGGVAVSRRPVRFETYFPPQSRHFDISIAPWGLDGFATIFSDITSRKEAEREQARLQDQLLQAQKMESVGRLAGGVAHDFNNMLQAILGNVELAMESAGTSGPLADCLREIERAGRHSAELTRQLLGFARKQLIDPRVLDLNVAVADMVTMLRRLIGEDIELAWAPCAQPVSVRMDPSQIQQIVVNLITNSRDAIGGVGRITVETAPVTLDETYTRTHPETAAGEYVMLVVSDTGAGLTREVQDHLFEPFYTSKEVGRGTGLGLATIYGIVKQNNGAISVYSEPGAGAVFKVYLPRCADATATAPVATAPAPRGGTETVLLVEDEPAILHLGLRVLGNLGYTVLAAGAPHRALEIAAGHPGPIHLLLTDVVMPGMTGRELEQRLSAVRPGLKCLFMSGYTANVIAERGILDESLHFIQKPFSSDALAAQVRSVLDG